MSSKDFLKQRTFQLVVLLSMTFFWAYWITLARTVRAWLSDPDYSHGFLVVPIALAIAYRRLRYETGSTRQLPLSARLEAVLGRMNGAGLALIAVASILRIVAARYYVMPLDAWSVPLWIGGVVLCFGGTSSLRVALPAIAFLWFAAPLPDRVEQVLSLPLQRQATLGSAWLLQCLRQPAVASGTTLLIGSDVLEVEHACSGLRMFFGSFAMATAFIFLTPGDRLSRSILVLAAAPIAVLSNVIRIVITAIMFQHTSAELTRRFVHDFAGLVMVVVVFLCFLLTLFIVRWGQAAHDRNREKFIRWLPAWPVGLAAIVIAAIAWHHHQQAIVNRSLLDAALAREEAGDWHGATAYLRRYLQINRDDKSALLRLGNALNRDATQVRDKRKALTVMTAAWKANPGQLMFALQQAELAMELEQYGQVVDTTTAILSHQQIEQPQYERLLRTAARWRATAMYELLSGSNQYAPFTWQDVSEALDYAIQVDRDYPQHAFRQAIVLRERLKSPDPQTRTKMADRVIDQLVEENPDSAQAALVRYRYHRRFHDPSTATSEIIADVDADLNRAIQLDANNSPRNVHILIAAAERAQERGNTQESLSYYEQARKANPNDVRPYLAIAAIRVNVGTPQSRKEAIEVLRSGLQQIGQQEVPLLFPLIEQSVVLGQEQEADRYERQVAKAIQQYPQPVRTSYQIQLQHVRSWRLAKRGKYAEAAQALADQLVSLAASYQHSAENYVAQSWATAAQYYKMTGAWDRVSDCYRRAAALNHDWRLEYRWALARQREAQGKLGSAAKAYQDIAVSEATLDAWLDAAVVTLRQQVLLAPSLRNWSQFNRAIDAARNVAEDRVDEVIALEVNQWLVMGQLDRAEERLKLAIAEHPASLVLHRSLAIVQAKRGDYEAALETAKSMSDASGDTTQSILLQAQILSKQGRFDEATQLLRHAINGEGSRRVVELNIELANLQMQQGQWSAARQTLEAAAEDDPRHIKIVEALSQLAWCVQDWHLLERCESSLRLMEGSYGPLWRAFRIRRMLAQSAHGKTAADLASKNELDSMAQQLESLYPHMQQTRITAGRVASHRGLFWKAVANYEAAWELGLPKVSLAVELIGLLNELGETERAQRYVQEVRRYLSASRNVIDGSVLERAQESADESIRIAEALAEQLPRSDSFMRLGRTLVLTAIPEQPDFEERLNRAEKAFRRAVEIDPTNPQTWAALFRYLFSVRPDPVESQSVLRRLASNDQISKLNRTFALAQLNESIGNIPKADSEYQRAIQLAKKRADAAQQIVVLERAAQYFRHHRPELSEACCREALQIDPHALGPQRILLNLLLARKSRSAIREAQAIIDSLQESWLASDAGRRLQADVWIQSVQLNVSEAIGNRIRQAIDVLQQLANRTPADSLRLAELGLLTDDRAMVVMHLKRVVEDVPSDAQRALQFLKVWNQSLYSDTRTRLLAERLFDRLEEVPEVRLEALDVRIETTLARMAKSAGFGERQNEAMLVIRRYLRRMVSQASDDNEKFASVVQLLRHLVESPRWQLAQEVTRMKPELLEPPRTASALATALAMCDPALPQVTTLAESLDVWLADYPNDSELTFAVGNVHLMMGNDSTATAMYRRCLKRNPNHAMLRNNLALSLIFEDPSNSEQCFQLLDEALRLDGRQPEFMDTLAVLNLIVGEDQKAVDILLESMTRDAVEGTRFLHLARAWANLGKRSLAEYALNMATSRDVLQNALTPYDRQLYSQLNRELKRELINDAK